MNHRHVALVVIAAVTAIGCQEVPAGGQGVLFKRFAGGTQDEVFSEGLHFVPPWNYMQVYDIRRQDRLESMELLTSNGLTVKMELSVRYLPVSDELPTLHQTIGARYFDVIIKPILRSSVREVVGMYTPEEIYSTKRDEITKQVHDGMLAAVAGKHVTIEAVLIRNITLPEQLRIAISEKLEEEQRSEKMQFTLARGRQEADRKRIEAAGIADFQRIVSQGLTADLLRWKGIEATEQLAASPNSKVVVIGAGESGLPLILGQ